MPNTAKSHGLYTHAYASAREKLPRHHHHHHQSQQQQRSSASAMYDAPQSTRPFMAMTAASAPQPPITAAHTQATSNSNSCYQQQQQQHLRDQTARRHLAPLAHQLSSPSSAHSSSDSYSGRHQISPSAAAPYSSTSLDVHSSSRAMDADRLYEKLQPPSVSMTRPSAATGNTSVSAAWRDEIEYRARAMERSSGVGVKRPAPSSSQRPVYQFEPERSSSSGFPSSSGFRAAVPFTPPAPTATALPTLSYLLQRNSDASSSPASSSSSGPRRSSILMMSDGQNQLNSGNGGGKRQRMFAPLGQPAASASAVPLPSRVYAQAKNLAGANNDRLRKILEKEVAFYNQRNSQFQYQNPSAASSSSRYYDARRGGVAQAQDEDDEVKSPVMYSGTASQKPAPSYYGACPSASSLSYSRANTADSPPPRRRVFSKRMISNNNNQSSLSHIPSEAPLRCRETSTTMSAVSDDSKSKSKSNNNSSNSPRELLDRDIPDRSSGFVDGSVNKPELSSLRPRSPPSTLSQRRLYTPNTHHQSTHQRYDSTPTGTSSLRDETDANTPIRNNNLSSSRSSSFRYPSSSIDHGESAIEAAPGLLEERSPSKRESITKLLLKSKEFLKAKSLVRNRNNEIDWVATFLNVGFESSSIYSLMCPLRKGRWKAEEEKYTMELLRLIESGTIRLRHGQSIRGFIAKKLHSDDMRVLKKLSNCKMFHFARMITPHMSEEEEIDEEIAGASAGLSRLEKLRSEFLRSVQLEALVAVRKYLSDSSIRELLNSRD